MCNLLGTDHILIDLAYFENEKKVSLIYTNTEL